MFNQGPRRRLTPLVLVLSIFAAQATALGAGAQLPPGVYSSASTTRKIVALTFDDGPSAYTPQILAILQQYDVAATFFVIGQQAPQYPDYVKREIAAGELVGNHTYTHPDLTTLTADQVRWQLSQTQIAIKNASGFTPRWMRPPYGSVNGADVSIASSLGLKTATWSVDPQDWSLPGTQAIIDRVVGAVYPGSVVLMHDGGGDRSETVAALPTIIQDLRNEGYAFDTLDQQFGFRNSRNCGDNASKLFSDYGYKAHTKNAIYEAWHAQLCLGVNLGAATSPQYDMASGLVAQNFRDTAHRIVWEQARNLTRVHIVWGWAAQVFSRRQVAPDWGHAITRAWMQLFLSHHDRGPALGPEYWSNHFQKQQFRRGTATVQAGGTVTWQTS